MPVSHEPSAEGFREFICTPFERSDAKSLALLEKLASRSPDTPAGPFGFFIEALVNVKISPREALHHWKKILNHKLRLERKLCRTVNIRTAAVDYCDQLGIANDPVQTPDAAPTVPQREEKGSASVRTPAPGWHLERLKEEMLRARRYKHALSAIILDADLSAIRESTAIDQTKDPLHGLVINIITREVRSVDILARHSDTLFLLILPNTNKREAIELACRLKKNIAVRIQRIPGISSAIPLTIAAGQCSKDDTAAGFIQRLENLAAAGKKKNCDMVFSLE